MSVTGSNHQAVPSRRDFLSWVSSGLGGAALLSLLSRDGVVRAGALPRTAAGAAVHHPAKARRAIHIYCCGGVSQVDSFDYKPELARFHGKSMPGEKPDVFFGQVGLLHKPFFEFRQRGRSGLWVSDLFPHLGSVADELCVIRSMYADTGNHTPGTFQANTGFRLNGFPAMGSWLSYGLGSENENLPAFIVLPDTRGVPAGGSINWSNGFLPARHQGVPLRTAGGDGPPVADLFPATPVPEGTERATRDLLARMNRRHLDRHGGAEAADALAARIRSYELAGRIQTTLPGITDLSPESPATRQMYGLDAPQTADFGRQCLLGRRLLESGVRFVQLFSGSAFGSPRINWDGHEDVRVNHTQEAGRIDQPVAALIADLRQRGMLDDTLVLITTEFGRTPFTQSAADQLGAGRDHNQYGFSVVLAGAGVRRGVTYGATDEVGWKAAEDPVSWPDFHATVLHLLGLDHERLTFYHNGIDRRLTNVHGQVVKDVLA